MIEEWTPLRTFLIGGTLDGLSTRLIIWVVVLVAFGAVMMFTGYKLGTWREQDKAARVAAVAKRVKDRRDARIAERRANGEDWRPKHRDIDEDHTTRVEVDEDTRELMRRRLAGEVAGLDRWPTNGYRPNDEY